MRRIRVLIADDHAVVRTGLRVLRLSGIPRHDAEDSRGFPDSEPSSTCGTIE
jgi:DNA-binding NarL/FixJ family response regulator